MPGLGDLLNLDYGFALDPYDTSSWMDGGWDFPMDVNYSALAPMPSGGWDAPMDSYNYIGDLPGEDVTSYTPEQVQSAYNAYRQGEIGNPAYNPTASSSVAGWDVPWLTRLGFPSLGNIFNKANLFGDSRWRESLDAFGLRPDDDDRGGGRVGISMPSIVVSADAERIPTVSPTTRMPEPGPAPSPLPPPSPSPLPALPSFTPVPYAQHQESARNRRGLADLFGP